MSEHKIYRGFFSYSHHDAETDPGLVKEFTKPLEDRVNAKLVNARFKIWRDEQGLRTGDKWSDKIEEELRASDVLVVLLTPRWIESEHCRKEYLIFEQIESGRVGKYVAPVLARKIEKQEKHLNPDQREVYRRINDRQYRKAIATEFLNLKKPDRDSLIDILADDIEGMIERRRTAQPTPESPSKLLVRSGKTHEIDTRAQNYERVDFVTDGEIVLDRVNDNGQRFVLAHAGFIERLYIEGDLGRIEFGVRRAFVSVDNHGPGELSKLTELRSGGDLTNVYYTALHDAPDAVTVCIDPPAGKSSLTELPLPPSGNENFLSKVAVASRETDFRQLKARLIVSLNVEGLFVAGRRDISPRTKAAIKAIMGAVRTKAAKAAKAGRTSQQTVDANGQFVRDLPVGERT